MKRRPSYGTFLQVKKCEHISAGICTISKQGSYKEKWAINFNEKATIVRNVYQVKRK